MLLGTNPESNPDQEGNDDKQKNCVTNPPSFFFAIPKNNSPSHGLNKHEMGLVVYICFFAETVPSTMHQRDFILHAVWKKRTVGELHSHFTSVLFMPSNLNVVKTHKYTLARSNIGSRSLNGHCLWIGTIISSRFIMCKITWHSLMVFYVSKKWHWMPQQKKPVLLIVSLCHFEISLSHQNWLSCKFIIIVEQGHYGKKLHLSLFFFCCQQPNCTYLYKCGKLDAKFLNRIFSLNWCDSIRLKHKNTFFNRRVWLTTVFQCLNIIFGNKVIVVFRSFIAWLVKLLACHL